MTNKYQEYKKMAFILISILDFLWSEHKITYTWYFPPTYHVHSLTLDKSTMTWRVEFN